MKTKTVYIFDATTRQYKGPYEAQESPEEPGSFIEPLASTDQSPPSVSANKIAVRNSDNSNWTIVDDFRGQFVFNMTTGAPMIIDSIGALPANHALQMPPRPLETVKAGLFASVDASIATIYANWLRFEAEYKEREAAARAYSQANYSGSPGIWITSFATAAGKTNKQTADLIIAQADALRAALASLGVLRMRKYEIASTATSELAQQKHDEIVAAAEAIAAEL